MAKKPGPANYRENARYRSRDEVDPEQRNEIRDESPIDSADRFSTNEFHEQRPEPKSSTTTDEYGRQVVMQYRGDQTSTDTSTPPEDNFAALRRVLMKVKKSKEK